jgi:hypothetical protein
MSDEDPWAEYRDAMAEYGRLHPMEFYCGVCATKSRVLAFFGVHRDVSCKYCDRWRAEQQSK